MALACVAVLYMLDIVPLSQVYESIEWPVVVLLGAMIPISVALEASGGTGARRFVCARHRRLAGDAIRRAHARP